MKDTVLITGAGRGLGRALADIFYENGYYLILNCKDTEILAKERVEFVKGDLCERGTVEQLVRIAEERNLSILINNAGVYDRGKFSDIDYAPIEEVLETNLITPIVLVRAIWPLFQQNKQGLIININSLAGKYGTDGEAVYCASKYGLKGFSEALQFDAIRDGIQVMSVFIGAMDTDMTKQNNSSSEKLINPREVAQIIFHLSQMKCGSLRITEIDIRRGKY